MKSSNVNAIPIMNSKNSVNGFISSASSINQNRSENGSWAAFDQNPNTYWCSNQSVSTGYDAITGVYSGVNSIPVNTTNSGILRIKGEFLQINMPNVNTTNAQNIQVLQYSIAPILDPSFFVRLSPNSWYLIGWNGKWNEVDKQSGQQFTDPNPKIYNVANPGDYSAYIIIINKVGNDDQTNRVCVQIAELNLFTNTNTNSINTDNSNAMLYNPSAIGYATYENCENYAVNNGYQFFGMQDVQENGLAKCLVSNDYDKTIGYGSAELQSNIIPLWASNTADGMPYTMSINNSGQIQISDMNNVIKFSSNTAISDCINNGSLYIDSATYGGNCKASIGNVTNTVNNNLKCGNKNSCSIPISNATFGDPAKGCVKSFDIAYKCGGKSFTKNLTPAEGQTMILDCNDYIKKTCQFVMILQDDGNTCLYKGSDPSTKTDLIWSTNTNGIQKKANPDWIASKGKYGRNYMIIGEILTSGEWIGSNDGSIKLIMQKDGNLVLYTSESKSGCSVKNNKTYGSTSVNAVYKIEQTGDTNLMGKIAYIDSETNLREYPSSMLEKSNQYQLLNNYDSKGNDIQQISSTNAANGCVDVCNSTIDCSGFVYQPSSNLCYLKNNDFSEKQYYSNSGLIMGIRKPKISSTFNTNCSKDVVNIDSVRYNNYIKGDKMTLDVKCNANALSSADKTKLTDIGNQMFSTGQQMADQTNNINTDITDIYSQFNTNSTNFNTNYSMYRQNNKKLANEFVKEGLTNIDTNPDKHINMIDIDSMLNDTDIRVLQENYSYVFWSILAVGLLTITVSKMNK
jgi:hypothetical protein